MRRKHLFEWEDQRWFPSSLRHLITDHLRSALSSPLTRSLRETVCDVLEGPLRRSKSTRIVDVCSGAGGPLPAVFAQLSERVGRPLTAALTDLYPNERAFERIETEFSGGIRGHAGAVSAFDVPGELGAFLTLFTCFHHFQPADATRILANAAAKHRTIVIIEPFRRTDMVFAAIECARPECVRRSSRISFGRRRSERGIAPGFGAYRSVPMGKGARAYRLLEQPCCSRAANGGDPARRSRGPVQ
jgi:hypothetical protein